MNKSTVRKILLICIAIGMIWGSNSRSSLHVFASSTSEPGMNTEELKENSWRYRNGILVDTEAVQARAGYRYAWQKVNGHYMNDRGEVIRGASRKGIDVSHHNGRINWERVKEDGIDFAMIRCGYGSDYTSQDDQQWIYNVSECERLGIPYGVYLYSYANSSAKARSEAEHVLRLLRGHRPAYPIYYDMEDNTLLSVSRSKKGEYAEIFCNAVSRAGYKVGIYANLDWWNNYLTDDAFDNPGWSKWVAHYNSTCRYGKSHDMWQCTSKGTVSGVSGYVDINFWMNGGGDDITDDRNGLQYDNISGNWYVYKNGRIDTSCTGVVPNENGWWYVRNGMLDWNYTGVAPNENGWWYIRNGALDWSYTGVAPNENGWWYIRNGALDWSYTGVAPNENGWWYIRNGALDWSYTGVAQNEHGWWYIRNGALDWSYTGVAQNEHGWWYIRNGALDWSYTGVGKNEHGWWYIRNGALDWNYNGVIWYNNNMYRVVNGCVWH